MKNYDIFINEKNKNRKNNQFEKNKNDLSFSMKKKFKILDLIKKWIKGNNKIFNHDWVRKKKLINYNKFF